jgi:hypothetical protein
MVDMVLEDLAAVPVEFDASNGIYNVSEEAAAKVDVANLEARIAGDIASLAGEKPVSGLEEEEFPAWCVPTLGDSAPGFPGHF